MRFVKLNCQFHLSWVVGGEHTVRMRADSAPNVNENGKLLNPKCCCSLGVRVGTTTHLLEDREERISNGWVGAPAGLLYYLAGC